MNAKSATLASILVLLGAALSCHARGADVQRTFHVAPAPLGDDANDGSADAPFATLDRARRAVRDYAGKRRGPGEIVVELRGGLYELAAPVRFEPADSGRADAPIVYRTAPGAEAVLSGGRRVDGWTREEAGCWRADVGREVDLRQLWVDGRRGIRARTPNAGRTFSLSAEKQADGFDVPRALFEGVTLRPGETEFSILIAWMHKRLRIARLADTADPAVVRAVIEPGEWDGIVNQPQGDRVYLRREFWLENAPEFIDAPGEFHLDRGSGVLRYCPRPGEDLASAVVVRPELENILILAGRPDAPVRHLRFEGLTFAHTGWTRPNRFGFVDVQANSLLPAQPERAVDPQYRHNQRKDRVPAAFQAATSDHIVIRGCRFVNLGGTGVMFTGGGNDNVVAENSFHDLAGGGIEIGEDAARPSNPRLFPRRNVIANNFISHVGADYFGSVAILGYYTESSTIAHNEIANLPYTPISQGWGWGTPRAPAESAGNRIVSNRVTNFMRRLDDGGGIYTTERQLDSEIAHNVVSGMLTPLANTKAGGALYLDQFTEGYHVHHNVVTDAVRWLDIWNPNIQGNRVETNYANTAALRNDGTNNQVEPAVVVTDGKWPDAARAIIDAAGIEPRFRSARETAAPRVTIVDSTGVDFHVLSGRWTAEEPRDRYGPTIRRSVDAAAAARWMPVLPRTKEYEVGVWRTQDAGEARYTIRHARGETIVTLPAASEAGWARLGTFHFEAGTGAEIEVTAIPDGNSRPLIADAVRFK